MALSLNDIAKAITVENGTSFSRSRRRVQLWADLGLLPVDSATENQGSGVHRAFGPSSIGDAETLQFLVDFGFHSTRLANRSREERKRLAEYLKAFS